MGLVFLNSTLLRWARGVFSPVIARRLRVAKHPHFFSVIPVKTGIQSLYLNSPLGIYHPTVTLAQPEKLALPCHSEPQAKNLFSLEILRHGLKSHSSE